MKGYKTSKDYKRLKELLDKEYEVVCFITYDFNKYSKGEPDYKPMMVTDVCTGKLLSKGTEYERYSISCRGIEFFTYWLHGFKVAYTLEDLLKARNIEFIEPEEE